MISRTYCLFAAFAICLAFSQARGQEVPPGAPGATGPEDKYVELSHSKDRVIKATAERYLNLVRFQEWVGATGTTQMAKYVSHDPDLKRVRLLIARGSGKDRVVKEFDVPVEKLNKTCQARVKQIDVLQKRLDELAATAEAQGDGSGRPGGLEGPGATVGERTAHPRDSGGPEGAYAGPDAAQPQPGESPQPAAPKVDPSATEPDPLGFAELPPISATGAAGPPSGPGSVLPAGPAGHAALDASTAGSSHDRKQWRTNIAAFAANIRVGNDPNGQPQVDWGEMRELREMNDIAVAQSAPEPGARSPEAESPTAISERLGDVHWQIVVDKIEDAPGALVVPSFHPVDLPQPIELRFVLDHTEDMQKWARLPPGSKINVSARLTVTEPYKVTAKVKLADAK